jgi:hypothetical protein
MLMRVVRLAKRYRSDVASSGHFLSVFSLLMLQLSDIKADAFTSVSEDQSEGARS